MRGPTVLVALYDPFLKSNFARVLTEAHGRREWEVNHNTKHQKKNQNKKTSGKRLTIVCLNDGIHSFSFAGNG